MLQFLIFLIAKAERDLYNEMNNLLKKFDCLMETDLKKSGLNSADHCEGSVYAKNTNDSLKNDEKIEEKEQNSNGITQHDRLNADRLQLEISSYNLKQRLEDKLKTEHEKKKHTDPNRHLIAGNPRKIKVVKIVPVVIRDDS